MRTWLRRIRGAIGMGLTWAVAWLGAGLVLLLIVGPDAADVPFPLGFGALGFLAGATFSGVLGMIEGRRRFDQMSLPRFAGWGAVGGLLLSGIFVGVTTLLGELTLDVFLVLGPVFTAAGAASAAGTLVLARMAEDPESVAGRGDAEDVGPSEGEARELPGGGDPVPGGPS